MTELEQLQMELAAAQAKLSAAKTELAYAQSVVAQLQREVETCQDAVDVAQAAVDNYQGDPDVTLEQLLIDLENAKLNLATLQGELSSQEQIYLAKQEELLQLQQQLNESRAKVTAAENEVAAKQAAVDEYLDGTTTTTTEDPTDPTTTTTTTTADPQDGLLDPIELVIDGKQVDFGMTAPDDLVFGQPHPRIFPQTPAEFTEKISDPEYANFGLNVLNDFSKLFVEAVKGNTAAGEQAAELLYTEAIDKMVTEFGNGVNQMAMYTCLFYDHLHQYLSQSQRETIMQYAMGQTGLKWPAAGDNTVVEFDNYPDTRRTDDYAASFNFGNDGHEPANHQRGFLPRVLVAVAFYGDGIRDEWCEEVIRLATTGAPGPVYKMYGAHGGLYSGHALLGLDSGGCQAGHHEQGLITGYSDMFYTWPVILGAMWHSATGDKNVYIDSFMRYTANWLVRCAYPRQRNNEGGYIGGEAGSGMTICANIFRDQDPEMSKLMMHVLRSGRKAPYGNYATIIEILGGDRRLPSASPDELGMIKAALSRGGDSWDSFDRWPDAVDDAAVHVSLTSRIGDHLRYEKHSNVLRINRGVDEIVVSGQAKKGMRMVRYGSGVWIFADDPVTESPYDATGGQGNGSYWDKPSARGNTGLGIETDPWYVGRIADLRDENNSSVEYGARHPGYRGIDTPIVTSGPGWARIQQDAAKLAVRMHGGKLYNAPGVYKNERTVLHLMGEPDGKSYVLVRDVVSHSSEFQSVVGIRTHDVPVHGSVEDVEYWDFSAGETSCRMTYLSGIDHSLLKGGDPKRTEGPYGERYDASGYYFLDDPNNTLDPENYDPRKIGHSEAFGLHAIFGYPPEGAVDVTYLVLYEIGELGMTTGVHRIPESGILELGGLQVDVNTLQVK